MKNLKTSILAVLAVVLVFSSCKYEEGPKVSLKTKKARIAGTWKVKTVFINGTELSDMSQFSGTVTYEKDGKGKYSLGGLTFDFDWEFSDSKEELITKYTMLGVTVEDKVEILRLTSKEFWVKEVDAGVTTETHYEKQ